jgi:hypothetical protein
MRFGWEADIFELDRITGFGEISSWFPVPGFLTDNHENPEILSHFFY